MCKGDDFYLEWALPEFLDLPSVDLVMQLGLLPAHVG